MWIGKLAVLTAVLSFCATAPGSAKNLGTIDFPNSGAAEARPDFFEGVLLLHNFEYEDAARAFRRAQELDPGFAMAYWGEAMTHNHPIWQRQDREQGQAALRKLAPSLAERLAKAPTEREKAYLETIEVLFFGEGSKRARDIAYLDATRRQYRRFPQDLEAAAFHSLAILGSAHDGRDFSIYMRAAAVAEEVFARNPRHPGAAHYMIHSYDDPVHAPLGLRPARVYSEIAPDAAHAQHMTSHIFVALGMWDEVAFANERARDVQDTRRAELGRAPNACGHYSSWLEYGYLQLGRFKEAASLLTTCHDRVLGGNATAGEEWYFARMRARYLLDTGDWTASASTMEAELSNSLVARHNSRFISALAALEGDDRATAETLAAEMTEIRKGGSSDESAGLSIEGRELAALLLLDAGDVAGGLELLGGAAEAEAAMPFMFGPPPVVKPAYELLGEVLLELERPSEAIEAFRSALERAPRRTTSLVGLARAAQAMGDPETAVETHARLREIWHAADAPATLPIPPEPASP